MCTLLHLPYDVLINVLSNLAVALKENGYIYTTFKYGNFEGIRNERYFTDMTEEIFNTIIKNIPSLELVKTYYNESNIKKQKNKLWINFILKKVS